MKEEQSFTPGKMVEIINGPYTKAIGRSLHKKSGYEKRFEKRGECGGAGEENTETIEAEMLLVYYVGRDV
ncbi:MAG: hypothetical protein ACREA2_16770 [Blastocatellia bacterium]